MKLRAAATALLAGAALLLSGCGLVTPIATMFPYAPSDGVQGTVGDVSIINALAVTDFDSEAAGLLFVASNRGEAVTLSVEVETGSTTTTLEIPLDANSITNVGFGDAGTVEIDGAEVNPGDLLNVYFQYGQEQGLSLTLPVLDGTLPYYEDFIPAGPGVAPIPSEAPSEVPVPTATEDSAH